MSNLTDRRIAGLRAGLMEVINYGFLAVDGKINPNKVFIQAEHSEIIAIARKAMERDAAMSGILVRVEVYKDAFILLQGKETFYNEAREMLTFETREEAEKWLEDNHPELQLIRETSLNIVEKVVAAEKPKEKRREVSQRIDERTSKNKPDGRERRETSRSVISGSPPATPRKRRETSRPRLQPVAASSNPDMGKQLTFDDLDHKDGV